MPKTRRTRGRTGADQSGGSPAGRRHNAGTDGRAAPSSAARGKGWLWFNWVRAGVRDGSIAVNAEDGWLHNVGGAAFVVVPDGYEAFTPPDAVTPKTVRNRVSKLGRQRRRKWQGKTVDEFRAELAGGRRVIGDGVSRRPVLGRPPETPASESVVEGRNW